MPNNIEASAIVPLKNSGFSKILEHLEKGAVAETAILSPDHFLEISDILGQSDVNIAASTSLVIDIIRTTRHLEISVNREDLDPATRALLVLEDQKKIRALALHLLPDNFSDLIDIAKKRVGEKIERPPRPTKKARVKRTCICRRCGGYGHNFRKCPNAVCCICNEIGPDHLSVHCPQLGEVSYLPEFRDDEEYYELLVDWEKNHVALEKLIKHHPAPRSPTPFDTRSTTATPDEETRERVLS
ncbi:uncharacterized protein HD556DRAFT_1310070 [Suillus plorans]|uniref:CCHC-type domain-containing protein n=1 Tax=Suillus plorans TaxID=116603 RepID=A0A9P7AKL0_9AGAM|nr:uncharacterized protein HD556DRAFT_1310070 [Suillus plorans]KAG1791191.1 hypothetical protein HD556DRAFT_1310070 [Suillus plorans]